MTQFLRDRVRARHVRLRATVERGAHPLYDRRMRTPRVLFVDDEPLMLRAIERLMEGRGFELYFEANARRALAMVFERSIDIVVVDYYMPDACGVDFLKEVYARNPAIVRILMGGAWHQEEISATAGLYAIDHFLKKPWP